MTTPIFGKDAWYVAKQENEQDIKGVLKTQVDERISINPHYHYYLESGRNRYPIYTGAKKEPELDKLSGSEVLIRCKVVSGAIDPTCRVIWPGEVLESSNLSNV
jgi:hypothetical protein